MVWQTMNGAYMHTQKYTMSELLGRNYIHATQDCYSLVRDYYKQQLGIDLPNFDRVDDWWEDPQAKSLYQDNFGQAGFVIVQDLQKHDVILCKVGRTYHINHALIYLGDMMVLHHPHGRLSLREFYDGRWQQRTKLIVRHSDLLNLL